MDIPTGVLEDPRPVEAKEKDHLHLAGATPVVWKPLGDIILPTQRVQDGSSSCVFQSASTALEILLKKTCSATPYFWRKNYPSAGAYLQDVGDIFLNRYTTTESLSPSQNQNEGTMNSIKPLTTMLGITGYKQINTSNIDDIAEAIQAYGQCLMTFGSNGEEYQITPYFSGKPVEFYHCICGVGFGLRDGIKVIVARDSAGQNSSPEGIRFITQDFLNKRNTGALYFTGSKDVTVKQDTPPKQLPNETDFSWHGRLVRYFYKLFYGNDLPYR